MARPTKEQAAAKLLAAQNEQEAPVVIKKDRIAELEEEINSLREAISRIAVLTGNGNHLAELGIERWVPGKKHMNKKFA